MPSNSKIIVSARKRFVGRAEILQEDTSFLRAVAEAKRRWNARDRAFAVEHETIPPEELPLASDNHLYPPRLASAQYRREDDGNDDQAMRKFNQRIHQAKAEWRGFVRSLCEAYWRDLNPTNWMAPNAHPAQHFVAACLIYNPRFVDTCYICNDVPMLVTLPSCSEDVSDATRSHETVSSQASDAEFRRLCVYHFFTNQSLVLEEFERLCNQADDAAEKAITEGVIEGTYPLSIPVVALPLIQGMNITEAYALSKAGIEQGKTSEYYKNIARKLHAENVSISEIARRLGYSRRWVQFVVHQKSA